MKVVKVTGILLLLLVAIVGAALFYLFSNINGIVKRGIEGKGPEITTTAVNLGSVDVELLNGRAEFNNFTIANPDEYSSAHLFAAKQLVFSIEPATIRSDVIVINDIIVDGVQVVAEQKGLTTNVQTMLKAIKENLPKAKEDEARDDGQALRFMVENLRFSDGVLKLITEQYGEREFPIPEVEASNLGSKEAGLTAQELGVAILEPYLERARAVAQEKAKSLAEGKLKGKAESELRERLGDDVDKAGEKLKGLF